MLSSSLAAGDADADCKVPFPTAMLDGVDMAAEQLTTGRLAVLWRKREADGSTSRYEGVRIEIRGIH